MHYGLGAVGLFFDTLGIGNYAPTTAAFRFLTMVKDESRRSPSSPPSWWTRSPWG